MAARKPTQPRPASQRDADRLVNGVHRSARNAQLTSRTTSYPSKHRSGMPWWGWLIAGFLILKAVQAVAPDHATQQAPSPPVTVTTIQGGQ